jgi:hypothetical protein
MQFKLTYTIEKISDNSIEEVISIFHKGTANRIQMIPDQILYGYVREEKIEAVINPPHGLVDPFKSRIEGLIKNENNKTTISLKIKPSWTIIGFIGIWIGLLFIMLVNFEYPNFYRVLQYFGLSIIWTLIPIILCKIKVKWDKTRFEKWLDKKIITVP